MSFIKALAAASIVSLAIAGSVFIVQKSNLSIDNPKPASDTVDNNLVEPMALIEKITEQPSPLPASSDKNSGNLTNTLVNTIGKYLVQNNLSGPQIIGDQKKINVPSPETIAQDLLTEASKKFDLDQLRPTILEENLNLSNDSSKESLTGYILALNTIVVDESKKFPAGFFENQNVSMDTIDVLLGVYARTFDKIFKLSVPKPALSIHKKQLELIGAKKNIYQKFKEYEKDPITALLAVQSIEKFDQEFQLLSSDIKSFIKTNNI